MIEVTGTVAVDQYSKVVGSTSAYEQTKFIIQKNRESIATGAVR